jgi:RNA polymerase primary sigma factor
MADFRIDIIGELARQMEFTPTEVRSAQLTSAEQLLHEIDPGKAYPPDFVIFRITGYRSKNSIADQLTGLALQHDLGLLIERVSDTLDIHTSAIDEPVLGIEDVTEKFNVTSKTIQRWRRRGLPARRFLFGDGKRRVGFLLSSVERFLDSHQEQIAPEANFSLVDDAEREEIFRRARRLASSGCCNDEIARRIARKLRRSPLMILHTIKKHDDEYPRETILGCEAQIIGEEERAAIAKSVKAGMKLGEIARRIAKPRAAVYRAVIDERLARLINRKVKFIDDPLYHSEDAAGTIEAIIPHEEIVPAPVGEEARAPQDLPPQLSALYRTPLLSPAMERALFIKFNFEKFEFAAARRRLEPQAARARDVNALEKLLRRAIDTKNRIVQANLRLVVSVARRHLRPGLNLTELVSDGYVTLMRAVESFDVHKGNRFSTYATFALMKGYARSVPMMQAAKRAGAAADFGEVPDRGDGQSLMMHRDEVRQMLTRLDQCEREVIRAHYGLGDELPATFEEVGQRLGMTKQRVRQIEQTAMAKLRAGAPAS